MESIEAVCRANLAEIVGAYRKATKRDLPALSKELYGNSDSLGLFLKGKQGMTLKKIDELVGKLIAQWPEGADFPFLQSVIFPRPERRR